MPWRHALISTWYEGILRGFLSAWNYPRAGGTRPSIEASAEVLPASPSHPKPVQPAPMYPTIRLLDAERRPPDNAAATSVWSSTSRLVSASNKGCPSP